MMPMLNIITSEDYLFFRETSFFKEGVRENVSLSTDRSYVRNQFLQTFGNWVIKIFIFCGGVGIMEYHEVVQTI